MSSVTPTGTGTQEVSRAYLWLVAAGILATFLLIILGGIVRVTDSGLGCPDWPLCNGRVIPSANTHTLIEYSHRLMASVVSALVIAIALFAMPDLKGKARQAARASAKLRLREMTRLVASLYEGRKASVWVAALVALGLLIAQVILGGVTVKYDLPQSVVTAHLGAAEALLATLALLFVVLRPLPRPGSPGLPMGLKSYRALVTATAIAVFVLVLSGAYVRGSDATPACGKSWPLCGGSIFSSNAGKLQYIHMAHRFIAAGVGLLTLYTAVQSWRMRRVARPLGTHAIILVGLLIAQVLVGAANPWTLGAPAAQAAHLALGTALWGVIAAMTARVWVSARMAAALSPAGPRPEPERGAEYATH